MCLGLSAVRGPPDTQKKSLCRVFCSYGSTPCQPTRVGRHADPDGQNFVTRWDYGRFMYWQTAVGYECSSRISSVLAPIYQLPADSPEAMQDMRRRPAFGPMRGYVVTRATGSRLMFPSHLSDRGSYPHNNLRTKMISRKIQRLTMPMMKRVQNHKPQSCVPCANAGWAASDATISAAAFLLLMKSCPKSVASSGLSHPHWLRHRGVCTDPMYNRGRIAPAFNCL